MITIDHYMAHTFECFKCFFSFLRKFFFLKLHVAHIKILFGHVNHATKTSWTECHGQHAKMPIYATFVFGKCA
jgi:hypothetical protein